MITFANKSRMYVHPNARLVRKGKGLYESVDGQWVAEWARYGSREWTLHGPAIPGEAETPNLREAQEYVADDPMYRDEDRKALLNLAGLIADVSGWKSVRSACPNAWDTPDGSFNRMTCAHTYIAAGRELIAMANDRKASIRENERSLYEERLLTGNIAAVRDMIKRLSHGRQVGRSTVAA